MAKTRNRKTITRDEAIGLYGTAIDLAKALGYERAAVYMWPADAIPELPYLRLRYELRPEAFKANGDLRVRARAA